MANQEYVKQLIEQYKQYLNNGQFKPKWRIEEVESFIKVMGQRYGN